MSSYLTELEQELTTRPSEPITTADLLRVIRAQAQAFEEIEKHRVSLTETVLGLAEAFAGIEENRATLVDTVQFVNELQDRLKIVGTLPTEAPFGALLRRNTGGVAAQSAVYVGNGPGQPLSKLVPVAL